MKIDRNDLAFHYHFYIDILLLELEYSLNKSRPTLNQLSLKGKFKFFPSFFFFLFSMNIIEFLIVFIEKLIKQNLLF